MPTDNGDFYQQMRAEIREWLTTKTGRSSKWSEYLLLAPDLFHLLCKLAIDKDVPSREKAKLAGAIAYFVSPIDLVPEGFLGAAGYIDDVALAAYVIHSVVKNTGEAVVQKHWAGEKDVFELVQKIVGVAEEMVGEKIWQKLKELVQ